MEAAELSHKRLMAAWRSIPDGRHRVHGFRSSSRVWAAEQTNFPREIAEAALAHAADVSRRASPARWLHWTGRLLAKTNLRAIRPALRLTRVGVRHG